MAFSGFPVDGIQFLADLELNNNKEWFNANKKIYQEQLLEPAVTFLEVLGERLRPTFPKLRVDTRTNGAGSFMRIYRDIRFSKDKTPYNTHISALLWEGAGKKNLNPAMGFRLTANSMGLMTGMHGFPIEMLHIFREAIDDDALGNEAVEIVAQLKASKGFQVGGLHYKSVPRGFDKEHPRAELLRFAGLYAYPPEIGVEEVKTAALVELCVAYFEQMAPLHHWLVKVLI